MTAGACVSPGKYNCSSAITPVNCIRGHSPRYIRSFKLSLAGIGKTTQKGRLKMRASQARCFFRQPS
ncbi:hypothetical protein HMPREF3156_00246 [Neisseria sp. HMSC06F02]|nr:hypothetical protein HMPREF3156_00246 [Neisseria sp. HMSC06F02]